MAKPDHAGNHSHPPVFRFAFKARLTLLTTGLAANILLLIGVIDIVPGAIAFAASVALYTAVTVLFWKCPTCRRYPGMAVMPDYCEKCGTSIFGVDAQVPDLKEADVHHSIPLRYLIAGRTLYGLLLLSYFVVFAHEQSSHPLIFWSGALAFIGGGAWLEWRWWRCPQCGGYLRRSFWPGRACTKCKTPFRF